MAEKHINAATYRSSFLVPELVEIQRRSFSQFLEKGIVNEFSKINPIRSQTSELELVFYPENYVLVLPEQTVARALVQGKTYSCKLYVPAKLMGLGPMREGQREGGFTTTRSRPSVDGSSPSVARREGVFKTEQADSLPLQGQGAPTLASSRAEGPRDSLPAKPGLALDPHTQQGKAQEGALKPLASLPLGEVQAATASTQLQSGGWLWPPKLSWVLIANLPLMTKRGHFIINGSPRVMVNQLVRSPGVYFHEGLWGMGKRKRRLIYADFVSRRGAWLRVQVDRWGEIWARLKKTPKIPFSLFCESMAAIEHDPSNWSLADREALLELHEEINMTSKWPSAEKGLQFLARRFKNPRTYDLGPLGRKRLNQRLGLSIATLQLTSQDLQAASEHIVALIRNQARVDDIDHMKNRRVRASGELVQAQFETGLYRLEKAILAKMRRPTRDATPRVLVDTRPVNGALRELFGGSPLAQYMDQTNPLAEITHKRRMSSLGPGGVNRDNASMAIRGIHPTHYGRICPIETPEGKNAGLVNSLTIYARLCSDGMLETPYYQVVRGQAQKRLPLGYVSAEEEEQNWSRVAPGDVQLSLCQLLPERALPVREAGNGEDDFRETRRERVNHMAISPTQMISVATSLIPFLEHDDANRALMGSNMQRQAVPLLRPERPLVGTGLESLVVAESGHALQAWSSGYVSSVSGKRVTVHSLLAQGVNRAVSGTALGREQHTRGFATIALLKPWKIQQLAVDPRPLRINTSCCVRGAKGSGDQALPSRIQGFGEEGPFGTTTAWGRSARRGVKTVSGNLLAMHFSNSSRGQESPSVGLLGGWASTRRSAQDSPPPSSKPSIEARGHSSIEASSKRGVGEPTLPQPHHQLKRGVGLNPTIKEVALKPWAIDHGPSEG